MTITTVKRCDKCHDDVAKKDNLWTIGVVGKRNVNHNVPFPRTFQYQGISDSIVLQTYYKDYCEPCMKKMGLVPLPKDEEAAKPVTMDGLLQDLVYESIQDAMGDH